MDRMLLGQFDWKVTMIVLYEQRANLYLHLHVLYLHGGVKSHPRSSIGSWASKKVRE